MNYLAMPGCLLSATMLTSPMWQVVFLPFRAAQHLITHVRNRSPELR